MYEIENDYLNNQHLYVNDFNNSLLRKMYSLALTVLYGYLTGTYYIDKFTYEAYNNSVIGYNKFNPFMYDEDTNNICSPICIYQNLIEDLEISLYKKLQLKTVKDEAWGKDDINLKENLKLLLSPFSFNDSNWHLLAGQIKMTDVNNKWEEINMISCNLNLELKLGNPEQWRQLTIDKGYYNENILLYEEYQRNCECLKVNAYNVGNDILAETELPPASLLKEMKLHYDRKSCTWNNDANEKIIVCNNNKYQYKGKIFSEDIFIRNDYYLKYNLDNKLKYFIYTERRLDSYGFFHENSHHIEIFNNSIVSEVYNY